MTEQDLRNMLTEIRNYGRFEDDEESITCFNLAVTKIMAVINKLPKQRLIAIRLQPSALSATLEALSVSSEVVWTRADTYKKEHYIGIKTLLTSDEVRRLCMTCRPMGWCHAEEIDSACHDNFLNGKYEFEHGW